MGHRQFANPELVESCRLDLTPHEQITIATSILENDFPDPISLLCPRNFCISISNTGVHIPESDLLQVFKQFYRNDPDILVWATQQRRILMTHDRATMPNFAYERIVNNQPMTGIFVVKDRMPIRQAIDELVLLIEGSEQSE